MNVAKRQMRNFNMGLLMLSNLIIASTCFCRLYYCLSGPLYSSTDHTMDFHLVMIDSTIVLEAIASIVAIMIFRHWSSFGMPKGEKNVHFVLSVLAIIAFPLYLALTIVYAIRATRQAVLTLVVKPALLAAISGIVCIVYIQRVLQFLRQNRTSPTFSSKASAAHRRRIGTFMMISSITNLMTVVAVLFSLMPYFGLTLDGRFVMYTMLFFGLTSQSVTQVIAFFPSFEVVRNQGRTRVAKASPLVQELRHRRRFGRRSSRDGSEVHPEMTEAQYNHKQQDGESTAKDTLMDLSTRASFSDDSPTLPLRESNGTVRESPGDVPRHSARGSAPRQEQAIADDGDGDGDGDEFVDDYNADRNSGRIREPQSLHPDSRLGSATWS